MFIPRDRSAVSFMKKRYLSIFLAGLLVLAMSGNCRAQSAPFANAQQAPSLGGVDWVNTAGPLDLEQLRGKFVLLDFWTYCCINCMHILPELKKLERAYPNQVFVIGVHSGKFAGERDLENILEAIDRYEIEHAVVNDPDYVLWNRFNVSVWPSLRLIDPEGRLVSSAQGEVSFEQMEKTIRQAIPYYKKTGALNETPIHLNSVRASPLGTPLRYPGKVLADEPGGRLFIADSNYNRIVISSLDGNLIDVIGTGEIGMKDGEFSEATFNHPQGMTLHEERLFVADTENHAIREIDLREKRVRTVAGTGRQRKDSNRVNATVRRTMGPAAKQALNSPWALCVVEDELYIAMAGSHQIWHMKLDGSEIGVHSGNAKEDIVDGPLLARTPLQAGFAAFAQPSGITSDGKTLFVADSEGSSIRGVPIDLRQKVFTLLGTSRLSEQRLFTFGDVDGNWNSALLQHPLDVAYSSNRIFVADTYNSKIKVMDLSNRTIDTLLGQSGGRGAGVLNEPGGIAVTSRQLFVADTNHHAVKVAELDSLDTLDELKIKGLSPPPPPKLKKLALPNLKGVRLKNQVVSGKDNQLQVSVAVNLPPGYHLNENADLRYVLENGDSADEPAVVDPKVLGVVETAKPLGNQFAVNVPLITATGSQTIKLSAVFYYCVSEGSAVCNVSSVTWTIPLELTLEADSAAISLEYTIR